MVWVLPALIPALFWLWFVARHDKHEPEPWPWVVVSFGAGMLSVIPAIPLQMMLTDVIVQNPLPGIDPRSFLGTFWLMLIPVAALEELVKFLAFWIPNRLHPHLDEPIDGLVYGAAAAMGFAGVENYLYVSRHPEAAVFVILIRSFSAVVLHLGATAVLAMAYARWVLPSTNRSRRGGFLHVVFWAVAAVLIHALYNTFNIQAQTTTMRILALGAGVVVMGLILLLRNRILHGMEVSRDYHPNR